MFIRNDYPILEFDDNRDAKINPTTWVDKKFEWLSLFFRKWLIN